jgi:hypothetical protein
VPCQDHVNAMNRILLTVLAVLALQWTAASQVTFLTNTGCTKFDKPTLVEGSFQIGKTFTVHSNAFECSPLGRGSAFVIVNLNCSTLPPLQIGCLGKSCVLLNPTLVFTAQKKVRLTLSVPNDPKLIGVSLCAQGGCLSLATGGGGCLVPVSQAARIRIQR